MTVALAVGAALPSLICYWVIFINIDTIRTGSVLP
jgi:hypothetical protein